MPQHARFWYGGCARLLPVLALALATSAQAGGLSLVEYDAPSSSNQGLREPEELAVSPDGGSVYATSRTDNSIVAFPRNPGTGALRFLEVQRDPYLDPPNTVLPDPNGLELGGRVQGQDLVGAVLDQRCARVSEQLLHRVFVAEPVAAEDLQRLVCDLERRLGRGDL